ncbi:MAG: hypothetical protein WAO15_14680 [Mycobacterium sp.]
MTNRLHGGAETVAATEEADVETEIEEIPELTEDTGKLSEATEGDDDSDSQATPNPGHRINWSRVLAYGVLPGLVLLLASAAGFLKWQQSSVTDADRGRTEAIQAARDCTVALLTYRPDTVERDLGVARDRLTGHFKDAYSSLTREVVIPGSKQKQISAVATVEAAASVSAAPNHGVVLLFVNQTTIVGANPPAYTASSVRVTLDKVGGRWLISGFDPV